MPLEVNEIGISMRVRGDNDYPSEKCQTETKPDEHSEINREEIVDDCVRRVLQILKTPGGR